MRLALCYPVLPAPRVVGKIKSHALCGLTPLPGTERKAMIKKIALAITCSIVAIICFGLWPTRPAQAAGPSNCPAGQTALAQYWGTSQYCALNICVAEFKHADAQVCTTTIGFPPHTTCYMSKFEARPRFPQPPSPNGSWGNQPLCPSALNNAATWY